MQDVPVALGSSGKTIKSKANDRVFVYYRWVSAVMCIDVQASCVCISVDRASRKHIQELFSLIISVTCSPTWVQRPWGARHPRHADR